MGGFVPSPPRLSSSRGCSSPSAGSPPPAPHHLRLWGPPSHLLFPGLRLLEAGSFEGQPRASRPPSFQTISPLIPSSHSHPDPRRAPFSLLSPDLPAPAGVLSSLLRRHFLLVIHRDFSLFFPKPNSQTADPSSSAFAIPLTAAPGGPLRPPGADGRRHTSLFQPRCLPTPHAPPWPAERL